jgi:putative ABC transport system permease protein
MQLSPRARRAYRLATGALWLIGQVVPAGRRDEWLREWSAELWHFLAGATDDDIPVFVVTRRLAGALPHAIWLRKHERRADMLRQDLRFALRTMKRRPGFALLVAGTLAVGLGACTAMFTIVRSVLLRPLPYEQPEQLVFMYGSFSRFQSAAISAPDFLDYREHNRVFESFAGRTIGGSAVLTGDGDAERVSAVGITSNFFATLGVAPLHGRAFLPEEEIGEGHDVVILSYGLWQRRFAGDASIIGEVTHVDGRASRVVGVMPALLDRTLNMDFTSASAGPALWRPIGFQTPGMTVRRFHGMRAIGRLRPGISVQQAQAEMDVIARQLEEVYPENATWKLRLVPYHEQVVGTVGRALVVLLGAVGLVLLIACGNVASLLLARASTRETEMAVRTSLGASRLRLVRQLLTESVLLAAAGGILGTALAVLLVRGVRLTAQGILPRLAEVSIDIPVLLVATALALATGLLFGLAPALHAGRTNLIATLTAARTSGSRSGLRVRDALVVVQVALSLVLLSGAGLLVRSLWQLNSVDGGFDREDVFTAVITLPEGRYSTRELQNRFWSNLVDALRAVPGVASASATSMLPLAGGGDTYYEIEDAPPVSDAERRGAQVNIVADQYFGTMHIPIVAGRSFDKTDQPAGPGAVIINRGMAERIFPGEPAIGRRLIVDFGQPFPAEIVGVAGDVKAFGLDNDSPDIMYFAHVQAGGFGRLFFNLVARTEPDPLALVPAIRAALRAIDADIPLAEPRSMEDVVNNSMAGSRFAARLFTAFAVLALMLAVVGLYGVLAYAVARRTRELGIRLALGAARARLFAMVVKRGMSIVGAGLTLGLAGAFAATRLIQSMLFQTGTTEPGVFLGVTATLLGAGFAACVIPAGRAMKVEPGRELRNE